MESRMETRDTQEREARQTHGLWHSLDALDGWISRRMDSLLQWVSTRSPTTLKLIWVPFCLIFGPLGALLSPVLLVVVGLVFLVSLLMLLGRLLRGQSLDRWKFVAAVSLLVMGPFWEMTIILYDPAGAVDLLGLNQETQE
jgi:hypothetical protein